MTTKPLIAHRYGFYQSPCGSLQDDTNASMHSAWIPSLRSRMTRRAKDPFFRLLPTAAKPPLSSFIAGNRLGSYQSPCGSLQDDTNASMHSAWIPSLRSWMTRRAEGPFFRLSSTAYCGKAASFVYRLSSIVFRLSSKLNIFTACLAFQNKKHSICF